MGDENYQSSQFPTRINEGSIEKVLGALHEDTGVTFGPARTVGSGPEAKLPDGFYAVFTGLAKSRVPGDTATHVFVGASQDGVMRFFDPQPDRVISVWETFKAYSIMFPATGAKQ